MTQSPWIPLLLGLGVITFGACLIVLVPSTLDLQLGPGESSAQHLSIGLTRDVEPQSFYSNHRSQLLASLHILQESLTTFRSKEIIFLLSTFLTGQLMVQFTALTTQYISAQFSWPLSRAGYLTTMRAVIVILTLLVFLPALSKLATRYYRSSTSIDLRLARISILFYIIGGVLVAIPNITIAIMGLIIFSLGAGFSSLCRSVLTSLVDQQHTGRLYAMVSMADTIGAFLAPPLMTFLFNVGLKTDGWLGLPFFGASCIMFVLGIALRTVRLPNSIVTINSSEDLTDVGGIENRDTNVSI